MQEFKINESQINSIWVILSKLPAIKVLNVIDMIRNLPKIENNNFIDEKKDQK